MEYFEVCLFKCCHWDIIFYLEEDSDRRKEFPLKAVLIKGFYILIFWSLLSPKNTVWLAKSFFFSSPIYQGLFPKSVQAFELSILFSEVLSLLQMQSDQKNSLPIWLYRNRTAASKQMKNLKKSERYKRLKLLGWKGNTREGSLWLPCLI